MLPSAVPVAAVSANGTGVVRSRLVARTPPRSAGQRCSALNHAGYVRRPADVTWIRRRRRPSDYVTSNSQPISTSVIASGALVIGMALLEVILLAGPAFAVGARRRLRDLALLASVGGTRADLRRSVLADAIVLGLVAGLAGSLLGILAAALVEPLLVPVLADSPGPFAVPCSTRARSCAISVGTALLAALVPALRAARVDVVAALAGRRGTRAVALDPGRSPVRARRRRGGSSPSARAARAARARCCSASR